MHLTIVDSLPSKLQSKQGQHDISMCTEPRTDMAFLPAFHGKAFPVDMMLSLPGSKPQEELQMSLFS